jgi:hypothetical protein
VVCNGECAQKTTGRHLLVPREMPLNVSGAVSRSDTGGVLSNVDKVHMVNHEATHGFCAFKLKGHNQRTVVAWDQCSRGQFRLELMKRYNLAVKVSHGSSSSRRGWLKRPANRLRMIHARLELGRVKAAAGGQCATRRAGGSAHM